MPENLFQSIGSLVSRLAVQLDVEVRDAVQELLQVPRPGHLAALGPIGESRWSPWSVATGLDLELSVAGQQVTGELTFRIPEADGRTIHGLYLQDAIPLEPLTPLARNLYGVVRFEYFRPAEGEVAVGGLVGLFWRPLPNLVLRADYLFANRTPSLEPGFHASISVLF